MTYEEAHRVARERGVSRPFYVVVRLLLAPLLHGWFGLGISGSEHIPPRGAAIVAPNHKSFWDSFFVAMATPRHLRFMGKAELFEGWWGFLLVRLGAFPVRRGQSDAMALETAREVLRQGGLLALFPEGTRVRDPEELGPPRRGAARLALEAGAPVVPAAITGTDRLWWGPVPRPGHVRVAFAAPIAVSELAPTPEAAGRLIENQVWPQVEGEFRRLRSRRGIVAALAVGLGAGGTVLRRRHTSRRGTTRPQRRSRR